MSESGARIDRREFLQGSLAVAAAGAMGVAGTARGGSGGAAPSSAQEEADAFLARYVPGWLPLQTAADEADWAAATDVSEAHTAAKVARNLELNRYVGAPEVIDQVRRLLDRKGSLNELTVRQLEKIRLRAAEAPGTIPEVVKARAEAEAKQTATQDAFAFRIRRGAGETPASANDIDRILVESRDLDERRAAWEASKEIGRPLREGLLRLRELRNKVAREMGFDNFFALQVADYGMTVPEMLALCDRLIAEMTPLHRQLHAWARHALAKRYGAEAPRDGRIPAHWLSNRWGQDWPGLVEGIDMDGCRSRSGRSPTSIPPTPSPAARRTATPAPGTSTWPTTSAA
jgi:peptidyl-dipeptidase A